jgi:hypothetical protein
MAHPSTYGAAAAAAAAAGFTRQWYMDPQNYSGSTVVIRTGSTYTDDSGVAWNTSGGSVAGQANASTLDVEDSTGLHIVCASGTVTVERPLADLVSDFAYGDHMLMLMEVTITAMTVNASRMPLYYRNAADSYRHRIANERDGGVNKIRSQRRDASSNTTTDEDTQYRVVIGVEWAGDWSRLWKADAFPTSDPLTDDLTLVTPQSWTRTSATSEFLNASTDEVGFFVTAADATNVDVLVKHWAIYRK